MSDELPLSIPEDAAYASIWQQPIPLLTVGIGFAFNPSDAVIFFSNVKEVDHGKQR